jgi:signal transduction histidine kinase
VLARLRWGLVARIDSAVTAMNELFNALLDISKLDAGVLAPVITEFPVEQLLSRLPRSRLTPSSVWCRR